MVPLFANIGTTLFGLALALAAIFLILLVLVQRGRGGGLAGALGGMGGSSAFGAKAGDIFTKITIVSAAIWIVLCIAAAKFSAPSGNLLDVNVAAPNGSGMSSLDAGEENGDAQEAAGSSSDGAAAPSGDAGPSSESTSAAAKDSTAEGSAAETAEPAETPSSDEN